MTFQQRFAGNLLTNVHFHAIIPYGVFTESDERITFHRLKAPSDDDLITMTNRIAKKVVSWLSDSEGSPFEVPTACENEALLLDRQDVEREAEVPLRIPSP